MRRLRHFSPNNDGRRDVMRINFRAELDDEAAVDVVDADGARVRRIEERLRIRTGEIARVRWDGRDDDGSIAPDGRYKIRLILRDDGRSILAAKAFTLDTEPPDPAAIVEGDPIVAPGHPVPFRVRGAGSSSEPRFRVLRTDVTPPRAVREFTGRPGGRSYEWDGRNDDGDPVRPGTYLIAVTSRDIAGNQATGPELPPQPGAVEGRPGVTIRALAVQPPVRPVQAGQLAAFRVDARGRRYGWSVRRLGSGRALLGHRRPKRSTTLLVRAPEGPSGVYLLEVSAQGDRVTVPFAVQAKKPAPRGRPLVVLPMITWLGSSPLDDPRTHDGLPDTFAAAAGVTFPRLFAYPGGLPPGFADDLAPLLVWMDRNDRPYEITTDLALAQSGDQPRFEDRRGVLFAGSPRWVSRGLARRLRRFVSEGGRVALFAPGALRAGVTVGEGRLSRPTQPGPTDAFGQRVAGVRRLPEGAPLTVLQEDVELGMLTGFAGLLTGFGAVEELVSPGPRGELATSVGQAITEEEAAQAEEENRTPRPERAALSAVRSGDGLVIRLGAPEWVRRLQAGDVAVEQITHNVLDLLHGVEPRPRAAG